MAHVLLINGLGVTKLIKRVAYHMPLTEGPLGDRVRALDELLREEDSNDEDESFDYDNLVQTRQRELAIETQEESKEEKREKLKEKLENAVLIEANKDAIPARRTAIIDDESDDSDSEQLEANSHESKSSAAAASEDEADEIESYDNAPTNARAKPPTRKSREKAESELAKMRRKLDVNIETYTKKTLTVDSFLKEFDDARAESDKDESDLEIVDTPNTSPIRPSKHPNRFPIPKKPLLKQSQQWRESIATLIKQQVENRQKENHAVMKEFESDLDIEEEDTLKDDDIDANANNDTIMEILTHQDSRADEDLELSGSEPEVDETKEMIAEGDVGEDNVELSSARESTPVTNSGSDNEDPAGHSMSQESSQDKTEEDSGNEEFDRFAATQVGIPITKEELEAERLKAYFPKTRRIFDSDSDSDIDIDAQIRQNQPSPSLANLQGLTPSQQRAELSRQHTEAREEAFKLFEEQAMESEDGDDLNIADDEEQTDDDDAPVENLLDDNTKLDIDEGNLIEMHAARERELDQLYTKQLEKDIIQGGWRRKKLFNAAGMLSDSDSDDDAHRRMTERIQRLRKKRMMESDSVIGRLAANKKTRAFAESMIEVAAPEPTPLQEPENDSLEDSLRILCGSDEEDEDIEEHSSTAIAEGSTKTPFAFVNAIRKTLPKSSRHSSSTIFSKPPPPLAAAVEPKSANRPSRSRPKISKLLQKSHGPELKSKGITYVRHWS